MESFGKIPIKKIDKFPAQCCLNCRFFKHAEPNSIRSYYLAAPYVVDDGEGFCRRSPHPSPGNSKTEFGMWCGEWKPTRNAKDIEIFFGWWE